MGCTALPALKAGWAHQTPAAAVPPGAPMTGVEIGTLVAGEPRIAVS